MNKGFKAFWSDERFSPVLEAMEGKGIPFPSSWEWWKRRVQHRVGKDLRPTARKRHHCSSSKQLECWKLQTSFGTVSLVN